MACNGLTKGFAVAENQVFSDGYGAAFMDQVCSSNRARLWLPGGRLKADRIVMVAARKNARRSVSRVLSSWRPKPPEWMAIHLGRPSPDASRNRPGRRRGNPPAERSRHAAPIWFCSRWGLPCHHRFRRRGALLPHPFTLTRRPPKLWRAVYFLWHFPWGRPRRALPGTVSPWSPDFPPPHTKEHEGDHPTVWQGKYSPDRH